MSNNKQPPMYIVRIDVVDRDLGLEIPKYPSGKDGLTTDVALANRYADTTTAFEATSHYTDLLITNRFVVPDLADEMSYVAYFYNPKTERNEYLNLEPHPSEYNIVTALHHATCADDPDVLRKAAVDAGMKDITILEVVNQQLLKGGQIYKSPNDLYFVVSHEEVQAVHQKANPQTGFDTYVYLDAVMETAVSFYEASEFAYEYLRKTGKSVFVVQSDLFDAYLSPKFKIVSSEDHPDNDLNLYERLFSTLGSAKYTVRKAGIQNPEIRPVVLVHGSDTWYFYESKIGGRVRVRNSNSNVLYKRY